ncbi:hypothetical protein ACHAWO_013981 [Cyclotella atomus]|uniref:AB hydrolase-1 domain-containing protein n=1 Tax=Cyclotella atomus TaxID=382360 RepID=A0ABD3MTX6_9STRA
MLLSPLIALLPPPGSAIFTLILVYILFEIGFFFHYHRILLPRANNINLSSPPAPYRDYPTIQDRIQLLQRIMDRLAKRCHNDVNNTSKSEIYYNFIESWFITPNQDVYYEQFSKQFDLATLDVGLCPPPPPMLRMAWSSSVDKDEGVGGKLGGSSSESSLNEVVGVVTKVGERRDAKIANCSDGSRKLGRLQKDNMDEFLSWAFFGVHYSTIQSSHEMMQALDEFYQLLESEADLTFEAGRNANFTPRCFTFEQVNSMYRPYIVYAAVALMRMAAITMLLLIGFRQYTCERGLRYWYRRGAKSSTEEQNKQSPFLFFHGIAPGGYAPYLPMIFFGLLRDTSKERDIFFFENEPVSYSMCFDAVSEEDTVHGVLEALEKHVGASPSERNLTLCGHSLGSCQLSMMVKSPQLRKRIQNLILIDPVSILLSEPDVMINFLYTRRENEEIQVEDASNNWAFRLIRFFHESKIHLVASSELFIEHYLRRNFAWYNSELWLDDIELECNVLVCLSEHDEIVNSAKVEIEVFDHNDRLVSTRKCGPMVKHLMWKGVGHAHCITHPEKWNDIHNAMLQMK